MSSLTPVSRDSMRLLKAQKDEEKRVARVNQFVSEIYRNAITTAEATTETSYKYQIPLLLPSKRAVAPLIDTTNVPDILAGLQQLFPDCSVAHKSFIQTQDGKMYDLSTMNPDIIPFMQVRQKQECIVVDWS